MNAGNWQPPRVRGSICEHPPHRLLVLKEDARGSLYQVLCLDCEYVLWAGQLMGEKHITAGRPVNEDGS